MAENYQVGEEAQSGTPPEHIFVAGTRLSIKSLLDLRTSVSYIAGFVSNFLSRYNRENVERDERLKTAQEAGRKYADGEVKAGIERANTHTDEASRALRNDLNENVKGAESRMNSKFEALGNSVKEERGAVDKLVAAFKADNEAFKIREVEEGKTREEALRDAEALREKRVREYLEHASLTDLERHQTFEAGYRIGLEQATKRIALLETIMLDVGGMLAAQVGDDGIKDYVSGRLTEGQSTTVQVSEAVAPEVPAQTVPLVAEQQVSAGADQSGPVAEQAPLVEQVAAESQETASANQSEQAPADSVQPSADNGKPSDQDSA